MMDHLEASSAVMRVGGGRGFVVEGKRDRLVITAAHCLPHLPPAMSFSYAEERTYQGLLGEIGEAAVVWAECLFVDPIADIAVLGSPDDQELSDEAQNYSSLMELLSPMVIADPRPKASAWLLNLRGEWFRCRRDTTAVHCGFSMRPVASSAGCPARRSSLTMARPSEWSAPGAGQTPIFRPKAAPTRA
jgi:hypothetical protein